VVDWVRFGWAAIAALAGVAEGAFGFAGGAEGRQSYSYLDDSGADYRSAEGAVFGE
jgi:hypothetical protein